MTSEPRRQGTYLEEQHVLVRHAADAIARGDECAAMVIARRITDTNMRSQVDSAVEALRDEHRRAFDTALQLGTVAAWDDFLARFPATSFFATASRSRREAETRVA